MVLHHTNRAGPECSSAASSPTAGMECECTFLIHRTATPSSWYWRPFLGECPFAIPRSCLREYPELADKPCKSKSKIGSFVSSPVLWRVLTAMWILSAQELRGCPWLRRALASSKSVSLSSNSYVFLLRSSEARVGSRNLANTKRSPGYETKSLKAMIHMTMRRLDTSFRSWSLLIMSECRPGFSRMPKSCTPQDSFPGRQITPRQA